MHLLNLAVCGLQTLHEAATRGVATLEDQDSACFLMVHGDSVKSSSTRNGRSTQAPFVEVVVAFQRSARSTEWMRTWTERTKRLWLE